MSLERTSLGTIAALLFVSASCGPAKTPVGLPGVSGPALPTASPEELGVFEKGLARIRSTMQSFVDDGRLAGMVTMVARKGHIVHWEAVGMRDLEAGERLDPDDIFRIQSMTKPITSTAIMMLVESGDIALDDPASRFIPRFAELAVLDDDGNRTPVERPVDRCRGARCRLSQASGARFNRCHGRIAF